MSPTACQRCLKTRCYLFSNTKKVTNLVSSGLTGAKRGRRSRKEVRGATHRDVIGRGGCREAEKGYTGTN